MRSDKNTFMINKRPVLIWGAGRRTISSLRINPDIRPQYIIDSDLNKTGNMAGIDIVHPGDIHNWKDFYVIINVKNKGDEIENLLTGYGLKEKTDFCYMDEFIISSPRMADIQKLLMSICFENKNEAELKCCVNNKQEYLALREKSKFLKYEEYLGRYYNNRIFRLGTYEGYCACCKRTRMMRVSYDYSTRMTPYWRETLICPVCKMNSRMRFAIEYLGAFTDKKIYIQEQVTPFFKNLKKIIPDLTGSEFLGSNYAGGDLVNGVLHEDAEALSFDDNIFDVVGSFDVFEHIDNYTMGMKEARRCLKPGGVFLLSVPVFKSRYNHVRRSGLSQSGTINHCLEPQYHCNPLSEKGSLVFHEFGWKLIDDLKEAGFREVRAIVYSSIDKGYLGELPVIFEAIK